MCLSVCVSVCSLLRYRLNVFFAPTSRSWMSKIFRDLESLGNSNGKKWFQIWTFLFGSGLKSSRKKVFFLLILPYKTCWKPHFPMNERPWVEGYIANLGLSLNVFELLRFGWFFPFFKIFGFLAILCPPYRGISATIRIGREMLCLPYAGFLLDWLELRNLRLAVTRLLLSLYVLVPSEIFVY